MIIDSHHKKSRSLAAFFMMANCSLDRLRSYAAIAIKIFL
tara:strand:- start:4922 stop:5041 length:120 start_codon:yes stop_codon:yes gene_type:complete